MAVLSHQSFLSQCFSVQLVLLFLPAQVAGAVQVMFFRAATLLLWQSQDLSVDLFVPKQSSVTAVL